MKNCTFIGTDADLETSLFDYGVIASIETHEDGSGTHFCVYRITDDSFGCGNISDRDLDDLIIGEGWMNKEDIESFLKSNGCTKDEFIAEPFIQKLHSLINIYGYQNIMGTDYSPMSKDEVIQRYFNPQLKKFYFNTGIKQWRNVPTYPGDIFINGELNIPFECADIPEGAILDFLTTKDEINEIKVNHIVREVHNSRMSATFAYFKKPFIPYFL